VQQTVLQGMNTFSYSIGTATLVGYGPLNYCWVFSGGRFASSTSTPQLGGPVIRTVQLPPPGVPHVWNDASEPQQRKVGLWARNCREFCRKWRLSRHFWVLLLAVNLRHGTYGFTSPPKEGALRTSSSSRPSKLLIKMTINNFYGLFASFSVFMMEKFCVINKFSPDITLWDL
jgi:hypothetical protein